MPETKERRPRGRPRSDAALRVVLGSRYTAAEAAAIREAARDRSVSRAEFIRAAVVSATGRPDARQLGAEIRADRRTDLLRVGAQLGELLELLREYRASARANSLRRALVAIDEVLRDVEDLRAIVAHGAGQ